MDEEAQDKPRIEIVWDPEAEQVHYTFFGMTHEQGQRLLLQVLGSNHDHVLAELGHAELTSEGHHHDH